MNKMQIGRIVARVFHRSRAYNSWQESSRYELAMCRHYGVSYTLKDDEILDSALVKTATELSRWFGLSVESLIDAYDDFAHSYYPYS